MNFTQEENLLLYTAVKDYQQRYSFDRQRWLKCNEVLDKLYPLAYTQRAEQPT